MGQRALPSSAPTPPRLRSGLRMNDRHRTALAVPPAPSLAPIQATAVQPPGVRCGRGGGSCGRENGLYFQVHGVFYRPRKWLPPRGDEKLKATCPPRAPGQHPSPEEPLYGLRADEEWKRAISLRGGSLVSRKLPDL